MIFKKDKKIIIFEIPVDFATDSNLRLQQKTELEDIEKKLKNELPDYHVIVTSTPLKYTIVGEKNAK